METEKCRALLTTLETGSFTAAAFQLGYTISGISRMMAALEMETGFPLLIRNRGGVSPTPECQELLPIMREMVRQADSYEQFASSICGMESGTIVVGASYGIYFRWLAKRIVAFSELYPHVTFTTVEGTSSELSRAVENHRADFCIISYREGEHDWIDLFQDELLVMLPRDHALAEKERLPLSVLREEPFIEVYPGKETDNSRCFVKNRLKPQIRFSCSDTAGTLAMVEAGLGISLLNAIVANTLQGDVVYRPLDPPQLVDIGIAMRPKEMAAPAVKRFIEYAMQNLHSIQEG